MEQIKHGGKRQGAGRKPVDQFAKAQQLIEDLITPAVLHLVEKPSSEQWITIGYDQIQKAYGKLGIDLWKTWFIPLTEGTGLGKGNGGRKTEWALNPKLYTRALDLIQDRINIPCFPTIKMKEVANRQMYNEYTKKHKAACDDMNVAYHEVRYVTYTDPLCTIWNDQFTEMNADFSRSARQKIATLADGWRQLIDGK